MLSCCLADLFATKPLYIEVQDTLSTCISDTQNIRYNSTNIFNKPKLLKYNKKEGLKWL